MNMDLSFFFSPLLKDNMNMNVHLGSGISDDDDDEVEAADMKGNCKNRIKKIFLYEHVLMLEIQTIAAV